MRASHPLAFLFLAVTVAACGPAPATPVAGGFCRLAVAGNRVLLPSGQPAALQGATLPTLAAMARAGVDPADRIRAVGAAGARLVSLPIEDDELTPLYFPEKLAPVLRAAQGAGVAVILSYQVRLAAANRSASNAEFDNAEDFLKLALGYVNGAPGVWLDPIQRIGEIPALRRRNVAQRMVDVVRGQRADNIVVIRQPAWFAEADPALSAPLVGGNVVYAAEAGEPTPPADRVAVLTVMTAPDPSIALGLAGDPAAAGDPAWATAWQAVPAPVLSPCR